MARCRTEKRRENCHEPRKSKCDRRHEHHGDDKGRSRPLEGPSGAATAAAATATSR